MTRALVVDDEENIRLVLRTLLKKHGYEVATAGSAEEALEVLEGEPADFVLADVRMPGMSGIELCAELERRGFGGTVIVMSAFGSVDLAIEAMKAGAYDYVSKPFKQDEVLLALRKAEERESLRRENARLKRIDEAIVAYRKALAQDDGYALAWYNLGNAQMVKGDLSEARTAFAAALARRKGYTDAHHALGGVELRAGAPAAALEHFRAALEADPNYARSHYGLAMAYRDLGDSLRSVAALETFKKMQGEGPTK